MTTLYTECFVVPPGVDYNTALKQIDTQKLAAKISSLEIEHQNQIFILMLEYWKQNDTQNFNKIVNSLSNRKIFLPHSFSTMKGDIHVLGELGHLPQNLLLVLNNYCNMIFKKE